MFQILFDVLNDISDRLTLAFWHHPVKFVGHKRRQLREVFSGLHPSTNVAIYTGVLWLIPTVMVEQYKSLYLNHLGLGAGELGVYNSLAQLVLLASALVGGFLADAWGRRLTLNVFDALSWAIPARWLMPATARPSTSATAAAESIGSHPAIRPIATPANAPNKWFGVVAILSFGFNMAANISYNCLLVEKNPPRRRADVYTVLQIVNMSPSIILLPILAGWWVDHSGLEVAARWMYGVFFVLVVIGIFLRRRYLEDDRPRVRQSRGPWGEIFRLETAEYLSALREYFTRPGSKAMFFSRFIDEWMMTFWLLYVPLFMVRELGLPEGGGGLARVNQMAVYVGAASLLLLIPAIHKLRGYRMIGYEQILAGLAVLVLLFGKGAPVFWVCFVSQAMAALAGTFFWSFSGSAWANMLEGKRRPRMLAGCYALMRVGVFLGGFLAAFLYDQISPIAFLWAVIVLRVVNAFLLRRVSAVLSPMIEKNGKIEWSTKTLSAVGGRQVANG